MSPKDAKAPAAKAPQNPEGSLDKELKKVVQYISQVYQVQKKADERMKAIEKRIEQLEKAIGKIVEATGKAVQDTISPLQPKLIEAIEKQINKSMKQIKVSAPAPTSAPTPAPAPAAAPAPAPQPAAPPPAPAPAPAARRPSDIPDPRIATVVENIDTIVRDLKGQKKVQRENLKPLIEQARDIAMNNLASRATAASTFKELIALLKSSPSDIPPETVSIVIQKLEGLSYHIRS